MKGGLALIAAAALLVIPALRADPGSQRRLELTNLHGGEKLTVTFHTEHDIDPGLYIQLTDLARKCGVPAKYEVISGYRSPATNAKLRAAGHAVAQKSQHMEGHAMDVRLKGCSLTQLR